MMQHTRPPATCPRLYDYFTGNDLEPPSLHGAFVAMASTGIAVRGAPDPDGRLINRNAVGFKQRDAFDLLERHNGDGATAERVSKAQRNREMRDLIAQLDQFNARILKLAYGPQDQVPELKLGDDPQARKKLAGLEDEIKNRSRAQAHEKRLGCWRQVLPECEAIKHAFAEHQKANAGPMTLCHWLVHLAKPSLIAEAQREAMGLVRVAWNAWMDVAGRRIRHIPYVRMELSKPWEEA